MKHRNRTHFALAVGVVAIAMTGCGRLIERAAEEGIERAIEADGGEKVDIDFSDGQIRVESADGDITFRADESGVKIEGTDADGNDFSLDADESGLEAQGGDGASINVDEDGTFVATDEDGQVFTGGADDEGGFRVEGSDGEAVFSTSAAIPDDWPSDVPQPEGLTDVTGTSLGGGEVLNIIVAGTTAGGGLDAYERYTDELVRAGFEEESTFTQGDESASSTYLRGDRRITVTATSLGSESEMIISLN